MTGRKAIHSWSGLTSVWKPCGITSTKVVEQLRAIVRNHKNSSLPSGLGCKAGHGGTLDQFAEGVLVIAFGAATKSIERVQKHSSKTYVACGRLGRATDSDDPTGIEIEQKSYDHVTAKDIRLLLAAKFIGDIMQTPPRMCALKKGGVRFSVMNRAGENETPAARLRTVHSIELQNFQPPYFTIIRMAGCQRLFEVHDVSCASGTYIRSLVRDIGQELGTCASVHTLERLSVAEFQADDALRTEQWTAQELHSSLRPWE